MKVVMMAASTLVIRLPTLRDASLAPIVAGLHWTGAGLTMRVFQQFLA